MQEESAPAEELQEEITNYYITSVFQKLQVGSNEREFCGDGFESQKDRRSRWVLLVIIIWSKMAQLGLEESSEVESFRRPK